MAFNATPLDGSSPNPIPMSSVIPDGTNTPVALEGGPGVVTGGNTLAPVSVWVKDGNDITQGASTDASNANSVIGQLKQIKTNTASITIGGTIAATQSGVWNITNISGTISLPTGAATSAKQPALGIAGTASTDVITVQGIASMTALKVDGSGVTQPVSGSVSVSNFPGVQPVSGTVTANAGTGSFTVAQATGTNLHAVIDSGSTTAVTQATGTNLHTVVDSGSITATQATGTNLHTVVDSGAVAATQSGTWTVQPGNTANTTAWKVDASATIQPVSGTFWQATQPVSGTVTAAQATASSLNAQVVGSVASAGANAGNPVKVGGAFNTTQPTVTTGQIVDAQMTARGAQIVSTGIDTFNVTVNAALPAGANTIGTVNAAQSGTWTVQPGNTANTTAWKVDGSAVTQPVSGTFWQATQPISGTVTANAGTNLNTSALALDTSVNGVIVAQSSTTAGEKGALIQGAVTTGSPTYTTAQTNPISLTTAGAIRVDASATTQPISGTVTANQGGSNWSTNVAQFAGSNAATGIGASGAGIPRVTVSNDSNVQVWDGTNKANVLAATSASNAIGVQAAQLMAGADQEVSFTTTTAQAVASTDVTNYRWVSVQINAQGTSSVITFQGANDNATWVSVSLVQPSQSAAATVTNTGATGIWHGPITTRYFRLSVAGISAGTTSGIVEFHALPSSLQTYSNLSTQSGTWTVQPGNTANTTPWLATINQGGNSATVASLTNSKALAVEIVDGSGTQVTSFGGSSASTSATGSAVPASGTYIAGNKAGNLTGVSLDASGNINVNVAAGGGAGGTSSTFSAAFPGTGTAAGASDGTNMKPLLVDASGFLKVNVSAGGGAGGTSSTFGAAFPGTGTALGASDGANMQGLLVESSSNKNLRVALYNGTTEAGVTANGLAVQQATGTNLHTVVDSGTVTANIGTTNGLALDTSVNGVIVAQGSTTSGEKGALVQGAVTTGAPTYTTAQTSPISLTTAGAIRVDASAITQPVSGTFWQTTQPISGTVTANAGTGNFTVVQGTGTNLHAVLDSGSTTSATQATAANLNAQVVGAVASAGSNTGNPIKTGGVFNTTQPTVTNGQIVDLQSTARGAQIVATGTDTFTVTATQATGTNLHVVNDAGAAVIGSVTIQTTSGTALVADQSNSELRVSNYVKTTTAGDTALTLGSATSANSLPVVVASDQGSMAVTESCIVSTVNSSTATLTANSVFTGTSESALPFSAISVEVFADQASAAGGLSVQQSQNGTNWDTVDTFSVVASTAFNTTVNLIGQFYRVVYTNGGTNQGAFRLQTVKQPVDVVLPRTLTALGNLKTALQEVNGTALSLGQTTMAASLPVTLASNQPNQNVTIQATSGTALVADQTNSVLRVSNYVKTTAAGDTALTLGSATSANSMPVVIASDQAGVSIKQPTSATGTLSSVAGTVTASTQLLASNTSRKGMMVFNESTAILYLGFSATVTTTSYSVQIPASGFFEMPPSAVYTGVIAGVWSAANGNARLTELT